MRVIGLFWNPNERRPRTLLRIAAQAALSLGLFLLPVRFIADPISAAYKRGAAFPGMSQPSFDHVINMIVGPLLTLAVLISVFVTARLLDRRPISDLGWRPNLRSLEEFGFGFEGAIYGFPVSGDLESASVIRTMAQGPSLLTGAAYGPEAGIVGAAAVLVGIGAIVLYARLRNGSLTPVLSPRWLRPGGAADAPDAPTVAHAASIRSRSEGD